MRRTYVQLVFGARQTGKSTLIEALLPPEAARFNLSDPEIEADWLARPGAFSAAVRALPDDAIVFVDEAQKVPSVFDAVQSFYDKAGNRRRFVLCGSSARKLRRAGANLLPGRAVVHRLHPLVMAERPPPAADNRAATPQPLPFPPIDSPVRPFPPADLIERLTWGDLPGIVTVPEEDRADLLRSYVVIHLEEEIRREALVRDWGSFLRFLRLAAAEAGQLVNYAAISREAGVTQPTVKAYYDLLEDMFVGLRVQAWSKSPRKNLLSTPRFLLFDLGVRHAAAGLRPSSDVVLANPGPIFEQWVGLELARRLGYLGEGSLHHLRTRDGAEVDYIVEYKTKLVPIEVKWTEHPDIHDCRHLLSFMEEHPRQAPHAYVVCRCARPLGLHDRVTALPWWCL